MTIRLSYQSPVAVPPAGRARQWAAIPHAKAATPARPAARTAANKGRAALNRSEHRPKRSSTVRWAGTSGAAIVETAVTLIVSVALTVFGALSVLDVATISLWTAPDQAPRVAFHHDPPPAAHSVSHDR